MDQDQLIQLNSIEIKNEKKIEIILTNIVKMLTDRNLLKRENMDKIIRDIIDQHNENLFYKINLEIKDDEYGESIYVKLTNQKIISFSKNSGLYTFLQNNDNKYIILIVDSISEKNEETIKNKYNKVEIFKEGDMMINLMEHHLVPKHILLNEEEAAEVMREYNVTKRQFHKIFAKEPVARYFNAKPGMIFKIYQFSILTGYSINYRYTIS